MMRSIFFDGGEEYMGSKPRAGGNVRGKIKAPRDVRERSTTSGSLRRMGWIDASESVGRVGKTKKTVQTTKIQRSKRKDKSVRGLQARDKGKGKEREDLRVASNDYVEVINLALDDLDESDEDIEYATEPVAVEESDGCLDEDGFSEVVSDGENLVEETFDSGVAEYGEMAEEQFEDGDPFEPNLDENENPFACEGAGSYFIPPMENDLFAFGPTHRFNLVSPQRLHFAEPSLVEDDPGHMTLGPDDSSRYSEVYQTLGPLGEGTYGVVNKARNRASRQIVAVKKLRIGENGEEGMEGIPCTSLREVSLLKELRHDHIVRLLDVIVESERYYKMYLVFEYVGKDLSQYLKDLKASGTPVSPVMAKKFSYQLLLGLRYCHGRRIIHRDLKPSNLLIDDSHNLKIADFGLSRAITVPPRLYTHRIVTLWYRSPELLFGVQRYTMGVDIWSTGTILAELGIGGSHLFTGDSEIGQIFSIFRVLGTPSLDSWPQIAEFTDFKPTFPKWASQDLSAVIPGLEPAGIDLVQNMLQYDSLKRISAKRALDHRYFQDVDLSATQ